MDVHGIGVPDLAEIYREEYLHAIEVTRVSHDPAADWDGFVEALWPALMPAFGLDVTSSDVGESGLTRSPTSRRRSVEGRGSTR